MLDTDCHRFFFRDFDFIATEFSPRIEGAMEIAYHNYTVADAFLNYGKGLLIPFTRLQSTYCCEPGKTY